MASSHVELTALEKELFAYTQERNYDEVKRLLTVEGVFVDCTDADGMTPLQHAAYKGAIKLCKLFLDCGASVNLSKHVSNYSALTFAGLSGRADVVRLLLEHGADPTSVNSINKTASQMAAFVGNHHVVSIINNFIPIQDIHYFTKNHGSVATEPRLPITIAHMVHKMAIMTNINPVRLALYMQANPVLIENAKKVAYVFEALLKKNFYQNGNELLALKFHHLNYVVMACDKFVTEQKAKASANPIPNNECLNPLIKHWIKGDINGFPVSLEKFLRQDVVAFPYVECNLFQQLVTTLGPIKIGEEPSAISMLSEAVNGQRGMDNCSTCATCGDPNAEKKCSACKSVEYCDKVCQKLHWFTHKTICSHLLKMNDDVKRPANPEGKDPKLFSDNPGSSSTA